MPTTITNLLPASGKGFFDTRRYTRVADRLLKELGAFEYGLSVVLVDDQRIQALNRQYRNRDSTTNVLSFPFNEGAQAALAGLPVQELGDIFISLETAAREAQTLGCSVRQRVSWLLVHGLLHLLGYDHERSSEDHRIMAEKEQELLSRINDRRGNIMTRLAINVDHIATIRQARGISEPDPVAAAAICELAGAAGIVVHLREDRRHIQDRDVFLLRETIKTKMNLEMGANEEIIKIALEVGPDLVTLVPEKRQELTTEGGLDLLAQKEKIGKVIDTMQSSAIPVSLFLDPEPKQIAAAAELGATFVELHTGRYADAATDQEQDEEFLLLESAADYALSLGLRVNAGHGLNYQNAADIAALEAVEELSIGHAIIARAALSGLEKAVRDMREIVETAVFDL
ncbi:MAG: pyridoxine 5'-phosphate synthase [Deltaproteobacteria bacterium]|nr:MAG: pyridoxine 5'-phosphate synthase [Deltaproteobacteria bacterium]